MALVYEFRFLLISQLLLVSASYGQASHDKCPRSFHCGKLGSIQFPFTKVERPDCGLVMVHHCDDPNPSSNKTIQLDRSEKQLWLLTGVFPKLHTIGVISPDLHTRLQSNGSCEAFNKNISIPTNSPLISFHIEYNITLFKCHHHLNVIPPAGFIKSSCAGFDIYHYGGEPNLLKPVQQSSFSACSTLVLPKKDWPDTTDLQSFLSAQMTLEIRLYDDCDKCNSQQGGQCQLDRNNKFYCDHEERKGKISNVVLGLVCVAVIVGAFVLVIYWFRRTLFPDKITILGKNKSKIQQDFKAFLKSHGLLTTKRYSYSEIKKITNCFKEKLGQGGYGSVFKGKLHDQCLVAVKVLNETKGDGEGFMNEVASISKTSHVNIVTLLEFCFEGSKKALIYEFMANGSLEKFIFDNEANLLDGNMQLSCDILHQIAMGVARGLEYLHRGCNTRILHFDIKPHNILLDENFSPKISDFGLAKICLTNESVVSMICARGTIGYIAPEVISRSFGVVSHKLDVYSFGMMVLEMVEMVGGKRNVNVQVDNTSEIYFPHWIYKRLELNEDLALRSIRNEVDKEKIRQMVIISFWCIQTNPSDRPVMSKVLEMLEGRVETLQIPPKPYLSSPSRSPCPSPSSTE